MSVLQRPRPRVLRASSIILPTRVGCWVCDLHGPSANLASNASAQSGLQCDPLFFPTIVTPNFSCAAVLGSLADDLFFRRRVPPDHPFKLPAWLLFSLRSFPLTHSPPGSSSTPSWLSCQNVLPRFICASSLRPTFSLHVSGI